MSRPRPNRGLAIPTHRGSGLGCAPAVGGAGALELQPPGHVVEGAFWRGGFGLKVGVRRSAGGMDRLGGGAVRGPRGGKCRRRRRDHSGFPRGRRCARGAKPSWGCGRDRGPSRTSAPSPRTARDRRCIPAGSHGESELRRTSRTRDTRQPVPERVQEPALHHRGVGRPCSDRCTSWGRGRASRSAGKRTDCSLIPLVNKSNFRL